MSRRIPAMFDRVFKKLPTEKQQGQTSIVKTWPAPVRGWNTRDPLASMHPAFAVNLENWFPLQSFCAIRGGCADHVTGFALKPKTLMKYMPPSANGANNKMYGVNDAGIFDATVAGVVGATVKAVTNGYMNWTQMGVSGGNYLIALNGIDKPVYFDGTTWISVDGVSAPALTGVTTTDLIYPNVYKRRLFFLEKSKLNFWYLAADAVGGALTEFLLGPLASRGGYTMAMATWSFDGGDGPDDYFVLITSEGEAIVFTGNNPSDATAWTLVGIYYVGKPVGRKCLKRLGGDLVVIVEGGVFPLSKALQSVAIDFKNALTNVIEGSFTSAVRSSGTLEGWRAEILPSQSALLVNIPTSATTSQQYVMNTITKAWCKFTGWNASDMIEFNKELYYADQNKIAKAWTGRGDYGTNIIAFGQTAFSSFGNDSQSKHFTLYRPMLAVDGNIAFSIGIAIDFNPAPALSDASFTVSSGAIWDTALWDAANWAAGLEVKSEWQTPGCNDGYFGSGLIRVSTNSLEVQWISNDYNYIVGGVLG